MKLGLGPQKVCFSSRPDYWLSLDAFLKPVPRSECPRSCVCVCSLSLACSSWEGAARRAAPGQAARCTLCVQAVICTNTSQDVHFQPVPTKELRLQSQRGAIYSCGQGEGRLPLFLLGNRPACAVVPCSFGWHSANLAPKAL